MSDAEENSPDTPVPAEASDTGPVAAATAKSALPPPEEPPKKSAAPSLTERDLHRMNRRELLKLTPLVLLGAFAVPKLQDKLLGRGVALSDLASCIYFSKSRLARTFKDSEVVPFEKFPYNGYDVLDPEVDLESWTLTVEGLVKNPGEYELAKFQALPKIVQNTRHVCVEGWDAIGNFGGARVSDFLHSIGADTSA